MLKLELCLLSLLKNQNALSKTSLSVNKPESTAFSISILFKLKPIKLKYNLSDVLGGVVEREFGFTVRIGGRRSGIDNRYNWDAYKVNGEVRYITPEECLLLQGFKKEFILKGTQSQKYYQVGNTIAITIANEIGKELIKAGIL